MTDRKLHLDNLILIATLKIYVFWYLGQMGGWTDRQTDRDIYLVWASLITFLQVNVGIKIRVSMWSYLSIVRHLRIPIPMCKKKIWVQKENL
jgi:hypothetical protein